jgi:alkylation response protein AidB-like acyl-CoA dehydrogenase
VPSENVLGEVGKGHKIAFNVLNFARFKLGAACGGGARDAVGEAARYAAARKQFGHPIADFGAIKHKIGEMAIRVYAIESLLYRTAGMIDARIEAMPHEAADQSAALATFEEYAVEASIAKVAASEMLDFVLDENIQIHGGNGYVRDYPAERHYRDSRVNRIFEGTNEINRLLIPGILARRAVKGNTPLSDVGALHQEPTSAGTAVADSAVGWSAPGGLVDPLKKAAALVFGSALQTYGERLTDQQEVLLAIADMLIDVYAAESAVLRASAAARSAEQRAELHQNAARVFVNDAVLRLEAAGRQALAGIAEGPALSSRVAALRQVLETAPINTIALRRQIADETTARGAYPF